MRRTRAVWFGATALIVVAVALSVQIAIDRPDSKTGAIQGAIALQGCDAGPSDVKLVARAMKGESSTSPLGEMRTSTLPTIPASVRDTTTSSTTTSTTAVAASPVVPESHVPIVTAPVPTIPSAPTTTATTAVTEPSYLTTTTEAPLMLTTTTVPGQSRSIAQAEPKWELAAHTGDKGVLLEATIEEDRKGGGFKFAFEKAQPGIAYQLGGSMRGECDGAAWVGPQGGVVVATEPGSDDVSLTVTRSTVLRVYADNDNYVFLDGKLRRHWQSAETLDVTRDPVRKFRWELPSGAADSVDWQVSISPFDESCDAPSGLVASGNAKHLSKDNLNAPENVFVVDFNNLRQSLVSATPPSTEADRQAFNGKYYVRAIPKKNDECLPVSNPVVITEAADVPATALTSLEVNRFERNIPKGANGELLPVWGVGDSVDWTSVRNAQRTFHWSSAASGVAQGEWQVFRAGDEPHEAMACADPRSLIAAGKAKYVAGALEAGKLDTLFTVDFFAFERDLQKGEEYSLRVVPLAEDGSCVGQPSGSVRIQYDEQQNIDANAAYGELQVLRGGATPSTVTADGWTTADKVAWSTPGRAQRAFHWSLGNVTDVVSGRWQLLDARSRNAPIACADDGPDVLASGAASFSSGPIGSKRTTADFTIDLMAQGKQLDTGQPLYVRVIGTRQTGACDIATQPVILTYEEPAPHQKTPLPIPPAHGNVAAIRTEIVGYAPFVPAQATPPYCYRVLTPFSAADAINRLKPFGESAAFLPLDAAGTVQPGSRICVEPEVVDADEASMFDVLASRQSDGAPFDVEQITPCPANACVLDDGRRNAAVEVSVTRDVKAPVELANTTAVCVRSSQPTLYESSCGWLGDHLEPGRPTIVTIPLRMDESKPETMKAIPGFALTPTGGPERSFATDRPWGSLASLPQT